MTKYIFPVALIVLDFGAAIVYAAQKDIRMATYWFAAAVLNITVTMGGLINAEFEIRNSECGTSGTPLHTKILQIMRIIFARILKIKRTEGKDVDNTNVA